MHSILLTCVCLQAVTEGEFPCPLCRSLGNALVPILPRENFAAPKSSGDACQSSANLSSMSVKELKSLATNVSIQAYESATHCFLITIISTAISGYYFLARLCLNFVFQGLLRSIFWNCYLQNGVNITGCAEKIDIVNALEKACVSGSEAFRASAGPTFSLGVEQMLEKMSKKMFLAHERMCRLKELRGVAPCPRASTFSRSETFLLSQC